MGEIINLMSIDVQRFQDITAYVNQLWSSPLQVILAIFFLFHLLGWAVLGGLIILILMIPLNYLISNKMSLYQVNFLITLGLLIY